VHGRCSFEAIAMETLGVFNLSPEFIVTDLDRRSSHNCCEAK